MSFLYCFTEQPGIKGISFTGSTAVGQLLASQCGERLIGCSMELGGKNALIVLADADLDTAHVGLSDRRLSRYLEDPWSFRILREFLAVVAVEIGLRLLGGGLPFDGVLWSAVLMPVPRRRLFDAAFAMRLRRILKVK